MDSNSGELVVVIGSTNPNKVLAAKDSFLRVFQGTSCVFKEVKIESQVSSTPITKEETLLGAQNRMMSIVEAYPNASYFAVIEGGFYKRAPEGNYFQVSEIIVSDGTGEIGVSSAEFMVPTELSKKIESGVTAGSAVDMLRGQSNTKQGTGVHGYATEDLVTRYDAYLQALLIAWVQLKNKKDYER